MNSVFKKLKELFSFSTMYDSNYNCDYNWVCLDCGELFDCIKLELFIKHQIDNKHYNAQKRKKM